MDSGIISVVVILAIQAGGLLFSMGRLYQKVANNTERLVRIEEHLNEFCKRRDNGKTKK